MMYDQFSQDYDRFVNWDARLSVEMPFLAKELASLSNVGPQVRVLDAACGTGQHLIALADQGFDVSGADFSVGMIERARQNAQSAHHAIPLEVAGFGQLADVFGQNSFDAVLCLGNSLPHVLDEQSLRDAVADFRKTLRPGGKLILQNRNFDQVLVAKNRWMGPQTYREGDHTWIFARFYDFDPDERITFNIQILSSQGEDAFQQKVVSTRLWPLTKGQLVSEVEAAGFVAIHLYGNLEGSDFDPETSENLVVVARAAS